jgi:hypothetical protein
MKKLCLLLAIVIVASCGRGRNALKPKTEGTSSPAPVAAVDVADVPQLGKIYSEAVRKARSEINADNAKQRLAEIEREIETEVTSAR